MIDLFTAPQDFPAQEREEVTQYLKSLKQLVEELYGVFQNVTFDDDDNEKDNLAHWYLLHSRSRKEVSYDLSKVFEYLNNPNYYPSLVDHHLKRLIEAGVLPPYVSRKTDKLDLKLLLLSKLAVNH